MCADVWLRHHSELESYATAPMSELGVSAFPSACQRNVVIAGGGHNAAPRCVYPGLADVAD